MLATLKERSGLSYDVIGRQIHVSKSALHRYCQGGATPSDFALVERFAQVCGATAEERKRLYVDWFRAAAGDDRAAAAESPPDAAVAAPLRSDRDTLARSIRRSWALTRRRGRGCAAAVTAVALLFTAAVWWPINQAAADGPEPLRSPSCAAPVALGRTDGCVSEVQRLLAKAGADIEVDGSFGPITQSKVSAYQALAGLRVTGEVDDATKEALYAGAVPLRSWPHDQVEARIRQVFVEAPDLAVRIAECRSRLDALSVGPNAHGSHSWGVFQLSDEMLKQLGGTRLMALDPEWNIQATHRRYLGHTDFGERFCDRAPAASTRSGGREGAPLALRRPSAGGEPQAPHRPPV
ncbi:MAG TPA: peptidoglycan-binding protein [Pilimelia sp.]|nr:peptidoglycan-binding protein [Pilimelia sp.]